MNYVCLIKSKETKEVIQISLSCREYHANKLEYVLGCTLCGLTRTENKLILEFK